MTKSKQLLGLDIGQTRIGVAFADDSVTIARPLATITMNETTFGDDIEKLVNETGSEMIVIGYPRNQSGDPTAQTEYVENMAVRLAGLQAKTVFQDESLTSVIAEERLKARGSNYQKADIDAEAAVIILQDYIESHQK